MIVEIFKRAIDTGIDFLNQLNTTPMRTGGHVPPSVTVQTLRLRKRKGKKRLRKMKGNPEFVSVFEAAQNPAPAQDEKGIRARLVDSFLKASHGDLASFARLHLEALSKDPIFYGHLARWYFERGSIRDHQELFAAHLLTSPYPEHREHGKVLMQVLRPYQVERIVKYCKEILSYPTRALRSAVTFYLRRREDNVLWFDEHVIRRRGAMKYLYSSLHIRPCPRADRVLFKNDPPEDSRVLIAAQLEKLRNDPARQAELIVKHRIHYTAALGAIKHFTPGVVFALATVMTPQQIINNLTFFEKRGGLKDSYTRQVIEEKIRYGVTESRVSDFKSLVALRKIQADEDLAKTLLDMTYQRLRNRGRITVPTAIFVDKSGSMEACIEIGKLLATMCSSLAESDLHVHAFDAYSFEVKAKGTDFAAWEQAFAPIKADGATSIGAPLRQLMKHNIDQILIISDGEENTAPMFRGALKAYEDKHKKTVRVIFLKVRTKNETPLDRDLSGRDGMIIPFDGDYYNLPNVVPLLCTGNDFELVDEIMQLPLHKSEDLLNLPPGFNDKTFEVL
jgi:hypothetical protein